jgi:RNA polymerase subunit RPABC4/transcription elongation factor Spt4
MPMNCKDCGAVVTNSDRFCPACGTPNASCKFHPKFGPALRTLEPRIVSEPAPAGAPSCPRCHRLIRRPDEHCRWCGMDLRAAWERYDRVTVLDQWANQPGERPAYHSPIILGRMLEPVLHVGVIVAVLMGLSNLWLWARGEGSLRNGPTDADVLHAIDVATFVAVTLFALGFALLVVWLRRCYRNLPALAVGDLRLSTSWAVWGWLLPGFNLFRPKQVMDDVWRGSHPMAPPFSPTWRVTPVPVWSMVWWATLLLSAVFGVGSHLYTLAAQSGDAGAVSTAQLLAGTTGMLLAGSALCLQLLVRRSGERQETRALFILGALDELAQGDDDEPEVVEAPVEGIESAPSLVHARVGSREGTEVWGRY